MVKFQYTLNSAGWADGSIQIDSQECFFRQSYITDAVEELLTAILELVHECVPPNETKSQSIFSTYAEPSGTEWTLTLDDTHVLIRIMEFEDIDCRLNGRIAFDARCSMHEFADAVVQAFGDMLKQHGIVGYRTTWINHDFPVSKFLRLKHWVVHKSPIHPILKEEDDCFVMTSLRSELDLLME